MIKGLLLLPPACRIPNPTLLGRAVSCIRRSTSATSWSGPSLYCAPAFW